MSLPTQRHRGNPAWCPERVAEQPCGRGGRRRERLGRACLVCLAGALAGCDDAAWHRLHGATMGTTWHVVAHCSMPVKPAGIKAVLERVDASMSNWREDSEISRVNAAPVGTWVTLSQPLATVMRAALALSMQSDGAFDVTVGALADAWGFGPTLGRSPADANGLTEARTQVGFRHLRLAGDRLRKDAQVRIDLSAIAKGYAVDALAGALDEQRCQDYLVEIGGEVRARGERPSEGAWRVAIEAPDPNARTLAPHRLVALANRAIATSGDYRNTVVRDGARHSHILNPLQGKPVSSDLASVSVVHDSAMWADGYATLIMALGTERGLAFAHERQLPAYLLTREGGRLRSDSTSAMKPMFVGEPDD